ncbi:hypothetical protein JB92DRAFT_3125573 [Gautieria morchelliformis]|nr:hypothetical protein JB92DRAFT_3125573 [Gautieria morchelliformis]
MALDTTVRSFKALLRPKIHNPARHGSNTKEAYSALARKINISSGDSGAASKVARESLHSDNAGLGSRTQSDREEHICNVRPDWEALVTKQILPNGHDDRAKAWAPYRENKGRRMLVPVIPRDVAVVELFRNSVGLSIGSHGRRC